eukprot:Seg1641.6 transcript_id=Seg1641.6/GoldUCD/mRNA.D3Y31 product="Fork head domain-containing protein FD5" protein_id=Seg1641.6/GoldUCD/D3Y31
MPRPKKSSYPAGKPQFSYISLCAMAIESAPTRMMTLREIYEYVKERFPYYQGVDSRWKNSLRHNLSFNDCFVKVGTVTGNGKKGNYWALHPRCKAMFLNGSTLRRRRRFRDEKSQIEKNSWKRRAAMIDEESDGFLETATRSNEKAEYVRRRGIEMQRSPTHFGGTPPKLLRIGCMDAAAGVQTTTTSRSKNALFTIDSILSRKTEEKKMKLTENSLVSNFRFKTELRFPESPVSSKQEQIVPTRAAQFPKMDEDVSSSYRKQPYYPKQPSSHTAVQSNPNRSVGLPMRSQLAAKQHWYMEDTPRLLPTRLPRDPRLSEYGGISKKRQSYAEHPWYERNRPSSTSNDQGCPKHSTSEREKTHSGQQRWFGEDIPAVYVKCEIPMYGRQQLGGILTPQNKQWLCGCECLQCSRKDQSYKCQCSQCLDH